MTLSSSEPHSLSITAENLPVTPEAVVNRIAELTGTVRHSLGDVRPPMTVFDLDATLFDNRPRVLRILRDFLANEGSDLGAEVRRIAESVRIETMSYRIVDTLRHAGMDDPTVLKRFTDAWFRRFFTDEYVVEDRPNPGAVEFVRRVSEAGSEIVYLTGRDTPNMRKGTLQSLTRSGFPVPDDQKVHLITKRAFEEDDLVFKGEAIEQLGNMGEVVAVFDNEPKMCNLLAQAFPGALHVFLDTMHSPDWEPLRPEIAWMRDFRL